jgi:hypothetical protein
VFFGAALLLECIARLPDLTSKQRIAPLLEVLFLPPRFYRGGFQVNGLRTLWSRRPVSISCNVALGEPNLSNTWAPPFRRRRHFRCRVWGVLWGCYFTMQRKLLFFAVDLWKSQFSFSTTLADPKDLARRSDAVATTNTSKGCRYSACSLPFFHTEFESTKSRSLRFSFAGWFSNSW